MFVIIGVQGRGGGGGAGRLQRTVPRKIFQMAIFGQNQPPNETGPVYAYVWIALYSCCWDLLELY